MPMGHALTDDLKTLRGKAADFAASEIATRGGLSTSTAFPADLWKAAGARGLLGVGIPKEYGGMGLGYYGISTAGRALTRYGCCLGFTLSWLMHGITARFFLGEHASSVQKQAYLPSMASGSITASIAISEPGVGGHPKHIKTRAERTESGYLIRGEKSFLTNGPIADLFIVLAVTGLAGQRNQYSAFIVPRESPGLRLTGPLDFGFLRPCPHGGIIMDDCMVPSADIMERPGEAYEVMAKPFRVVEDALMMGPLLGAQEVRLHEVTGAMREGANPPGEEVLFHLGGLSAALSAIEIIAAESAQRLDDGKDHAGIVRLVLAFRNISTGVHQEYADLMNLAGLNPSEIYQTLTHDLDHIVSFAAKVSRAKQMKIGTGLIS